MAAVNPETGVMTQTDTFTDLPPESAERKLTFAMAASECKLKSVSVNGRAAEVVREGSTNYSLIYLVRVALPTGKNAIVESRWELTGDTPIVALTIVQYDSPETKH